MKNIINLLAYSLLTPLLAMSLSAKASDTLNYEKVIPQESLIESPNYIVLNIFESEDSAIPIASQTYISGEWQLIENSSAQILRISMDNASILNDYPTLWAQVEVDGTTMGARELLAVIEPGISVEGLVESRSGGFKFPDLSVQTTAGATVSDLAAHQANGSAHHAEYLDGDAVGAMGAKTNGNPLNHDKYLDGTAVAAMGAKANGNPLNHDRLNNVTTDEIVNGTINPVDLNITEAFTFDGITNTGATTIISFEDIKILDDVNGFRWYNSAGDTQLASIVVRGTTVEFYANNQSLRPLIYSNDNGIGIGTNSPSSTHAVTVPSLLVTGNLEVGLERVSSNYSVSSTATCHSHGNLTCFYGSTTIACPVGTRVLGGGTFATTSARFGSVSANYPDSSTSWTCASSYDLSTNDTCYAICARLE